jgi:hypothetical protein
VGLAGELSLLSQARHALSDRKGALVLRLLRQLDEEHPQGMLLQERRATKILALCLVGRSDEAKQESVRFFERWQDSVYADRLQNSCAAK